MGSHFRDFLFPLDDPRLAAVRGVDPYSYADAMREHPVAGPLLADWLTLFETGPFRGITCDGVPTSGLLPVEVDEGAPTAASVAAANALFEALSENERRKLTHPLDTRVWRAWMNPEFYVNRFGLRLEELDDTVLALTLDLIRAGTSPSGYEKVRNTMRVNDFLGQLVDLPTIVNEFSYNINVFGNPSHTEPWGWSLFGHHLCLNCVFIGDQQIFAPVFFGAEPVEIDAGDYAGTTLLRDLERYARDELMPALPPQELARAILTRQKRDPQFPPGRVHPGDELHLGGAFQDNRVIPYEGSCVADWPQPNRDQLLGLIELFLDYQPEGPRSARLSDVRRHLDSTFFCWIGGTSDGAAFYFRIQSPVILIEFDHHAGIFLSNDQPEHFHIHTLVRFPNGIDYGTDLIRRVTAADHTLEQIL